MKETLHCYLRVSSISQEETGTSLETQRELGKLKAEQLKMNVKFWDEGAKSSDHEEIDKRPKLSALMSSVEDGDVKNVWVVESSRLSRTESISVFIRHRFRKHKVNYFVRDTKYDFADPKDNLFNQILDAFSQYENAIRKERIRLGKFKKAKLGYWHGGPPVFGYKIVEDKNGSKLAVDENESKWVKYIFKNYESGKSTVSIQSHLLSKGVIARRGGTLSLGSIQAILRNTHYKGSYVYTDGISDESITVKCQKIVDTALWNSVQRKIALSNQRKNTVSRPIKFSLLRDFMFCGDCGNAMGQKIVLKQNRQVYYCPRKNSKWEWDKRNNNKDRTKHCSNNRSLNMNMTNDLVWNTVKSLVAKSHLLKEQIKQESLLKKNETDAELKTKLQSSKVMENRSIKQIEMIDKAIANVETDKLMKRIDNKQYKLITDNLTKEKMKHQNTLLKVKNEMQELGNREKWVDWLSKFKKTYQDVDELSDADKKIYLSGVLNKIAVKYDAKTTNHKLNIAFKYPIVDDRYETILGDEKQGRTKRKYRIIEGKKSMKLTENFNARKLTVNKGLQKKKPQSYSQTNSVTVE